MVREARWFEEFHKRLTPTTEMADRIQSGVRRFKTFVAQDDVLAEAVVAEPFLQGSYPQFTLARPLEGTYDVDVTLPLKPESVAKLGGDSRRVMAVVEDRLRRDSFYDRVLTPKTKCHRLEYAGDFHIDVVPMQPSSDEVAPWALPDGTGEWRLTNPLEFKAWVRRINDECDQWFVRSVKFLKRWRERRLGPNFPGRSIFLTAFAGTHNPFAPGLAHTAMAYKGKHATNDAEFFLSITRTMADCMRKWGNKFHLENPVLPGEDLAAPMSVSDMHLMRRELEHLADVARRAHLEHDDAKALAMWQEVLSDDFGP